MAEADIGGSPGRQHTRRVTNTGTGVHQRIQQARDTSCGLDIGMRGSPGGKHGNGVTSTDITQHVQQFGNAWRVAEAGIGGSTGRQQGYRVARTGCLQCRYQIGNSLRVVHADAGNGITGKQRSDRIVSATLN